MLKDLALENFRNYTKAVFEFDRFNIIIGPNGSGKSNIIEAISLLSSCRSFREDDKKNLIKSDSDFARIVCGELEVFIQKVPKTLFKPRYKGQFKRQSEFVGLLKAVVFSPESISIICGTPKNRRRFLDMLISQKSGEYLRALVNYEKIRLERNALLERIRNGEGKPSELDFWNDGLVAEGSVLLKYRAEAVDYLNSCTPRHYATISGRPEQNFKIEYKGTTKISDFLINLSRLESAEVARGKTLIGPHKDDVIFNLNGSDMAKFASRGEIRSAILALKLGELQYLENKNDQADQSAPILLLDDVFSEFDAARRRHILDLVQNHQTIITTTDKSFLPEGFLVNAKVIELETNSKG